MAESGEYSLSMQNSDRCVLPVISANRLRSARSTSRRRHLALRQLLHRDTQLVQLSSSRLVDARRLRRRADEHAGEWYDNAGMVLPVTHQAAGTCGLRRIGLGRAATTRRDMVAAAGAGMAAVEHELLGAQARQAHASSYRTFGVIDHLLPAVRRVHVDLDDTGSG